MIVIGVSGQLESGKDTFASKLISSGQGWRRIAFADALKARYCTKFGVTLAMMESWKPRAESPPWDQVPVRKALQDLGQSERDRDPLYWINRLWEMNPERGIIADARYDNEIDRIKQQGGLLFLVVRPGKVNQDPHPSESQLRRYVDATVQTKLRTEGDHGDGWHKAGIIHGDLIKKRLEDFPFHYALWNGGTKEEFGAMVEEWVLPLTEAYIDVGGLTKESKEGAVLA